MTPEFLTINWCFVCIENMVEWSTSYPAALAPGHPSWGVGVMDSN